MSEPGKGSQMRVMRLPEVEHKTGLRHTRIYELIRVGEFPDRVRIADNAVGWLEHEIDAWIQQKMDNRDQGRDEPSTRGVLAKFVHRRGLK